MDNTELKQRMIGLITQTYYALHDGKDLHDPEVTAGLSTLVDDLLACNLQTSVGVPATPEATQAVITTCVKDVVGQVGNQTMRIFAQMPFFFCEFALHAERTTPDVDVPEFLRQAGLRTASGD